MSSTLTISVEHIDKESIFYTLEITHENPQ